MDRGTWIAIVVLIVASAGFLAIQASINAPDIAPATAAPTSNPTTPQPAAPLPDTDTADCQTIASDAAQSDQASQGDNISVVEANFNQSLGQCYYELDIFTAAGNETDLRMAPNDQVVASCTTNSNDSLSCENASGAVITEPQFKALLTQYLGD